jgi:quercetin dioxygenase-like cupin family protein/hemerythrin-like domain-containing protein
MSLIIGPASELAQFDSDSFGTVTLLATEHVRVLLAAFEPGQEIPLHAPEIDLVVAVVEGVGELFAGDRVYPLRAGDVAVVPAGQTRGIRARAARLVVLNVVTPPPSAGDHARVAAGAAWPQKREPTADPAALIRAEHGELRPHLEHLRALADEVEAAAEQPLRERLRQAAAFLRGGILPHAAIEEATVYPALDRLLRALGGGTATMALEHVLIGARVEELERLVDSEPYDGPTRAELRRSLTALEAVLRGHFEKEERVYVPLLAHLAPAESAALAAGLEAAASEGHQH